MSLGQLIYGKNMSLFREERERLGFQQEELAGKIDVTRRTISRWENDDAPIPSDKLKLCAALGFDIQYVITGVRNSQKGKIFSWEDIDKAGHGMLYDAALIKAINIDSEQTYNLLHLLLMKNLEKTSGHRLPNDSVDASKTG